MKKSTKSNFITFSIVIGFYIVVQLLAAAGVLTNSFSGQLVPICAYVVMAVSLNLVVGFLGELSLGHAGFMSVGAFSGTLVWVSLYDVAPHWLALILAFVVGGAMAGIFGVIVGVPVLRLSGDYLAIVTLAFGEIIKNIMNAVYLGVDDSGLHFSLKDAASMNMAEDGKILINGAMGITGIKITRYKLMAFVLSSVFAGMAGVLYSLNYSSLVAKKFDYNTSINILVFVVLGGIGSIRGSVIAAAILTVLPEMLRGLNDYRMLIYAIVLIVMMIFTRSPKLVAWRKEVAEKITEKFPILKLNKFLKDKSKKEAA